MQNVDFCDQILIFSLALLPYGFASCGEDGTVRVWKGSLSSLLHPFFLTFIPLLFSPNTSLHFLIIIYPLSLSLPPLPLSSDSVCTQVICLPCVSVWCVTASSNGDIVVGSRLF